MNNLKTSKNGLEFISRWEGVVLQPYMDVGGLWTIGVGHLITPYDSFSTISNEKIKSLLKSKDRSHPYSELLISREEALEILAEDITNVEVALNRDIKVPLNQNQFDALVSFTFNLGSGALRASTLLKKLNDSDYEGASNEFKRWDKARVNGELVSVKGLRLRRIEEALMFRFGEYE